MTGLSQEEIARLVDTLGPTLVALAAGCKDRRLPAAWSTGESTPNEHNQERLVVLKEALDTVAGEHGTETAVKWFIGPNCYDEAMPAFVIRVGHFDEVRICAKRMAAGTNEY